MLGYSLILSAVGLALAVFAIMLFFWIVALRRVVPGRRASGVAEP